MNWRDLTYLLSMEKLRFRLVLLTSIINVLK